MSNRRVHFIGICGAGMSAVAKLLKEQGWVVSGSDEGFYPPISNYLIANNLPCRTPYAAKNIPSDVELIVIGKNAKLIPETNPEVAAAFQLKQTRGIRIASFPEVLHELTAKTKNYIVAGSFGKSTCATLLAWTLIHADKDPSYFLGAVPIAAPFEASAKEGFDTNAHLGGGKTFVLEGDEYPSANWDSRSKFLHYNPSSVLLTSAEHDHLNVFPTIEDYLKPYRELIKIIPPLGNLIACLDGENIKQLINESNRPVITYSFNQAGGGNWYAANIERGSTSLTTSGTVSRFDLVFNGTVVTKIETQLLGDHNIQNMVGAAALLLTEQIVTIDQLTSAFRQFRGVKRRLELKTPAAILPVYEDFGTSRAKALAGFRTIRQHYPNRRIIAVFEPHTFSWRNRNALEWYDTLFNDVDIAFIFEPATQGAATHDQVSRDEIVARVRTGGSTGLTTSKEVYGVATRGELLQQLTPRLKQGDVVIMSTSGGMDGAIEAVLGYIQKKFPK